MGFLEERAERHLELRGSGLWRVLERRQRTVLGGEFREKAAAMAEDLEIGDEGRYEVLVAAAAVVAVAAIDGVG